ncbi:MAG: hypothetical protein WEA11_06490 [Acidimicrobiales bacterium]
MARRQRTITVVVGLCVILVIVGVGARLLGGRANDSSSALSKEKARSAGFVNRLTVVDMLDESLLVTVSGVDPSEWGRTPPDDEAPAGLQGADVGAGRVSEVAALRPLRIEDGGGDATFTLSFATQTADPSLRTTVATVLVRSSATEYCPPNSGKCFENTAWFNWQDGPEPPLDVFGKCIENERAVGFYVNKLGIRQTVYATFQCEANYFQSYLVLSSRAAS